MPLSQINGSFLREAEREYLDQQATMEVPFMEPSGKVNQIVLRQWDMPKASGKKSSCYVLIKFWNEHEAGHAAFGDAQKQVDVILGKLKTKTASIADIQTDIDKKKLEVLRASKVEQECIEEQDALIPIEQAARQKVAELKSILDTEKSQGSVLKAILQAKESNRIEGIYGRMGDLGAIDAKYDVAISTACPGLDYIVVETTGAAQACVELLRRENLGVATFMILEKQAEFLPKLKERKTYTLIDEHKDALDNAKSNYDKVKKAVDELRASEVDAEYKLQDIKKAYKELELKARGYKKRLDNLLIKHMEQIQKDLVDPEKLQATLSDETLNEACDLKRALEMVALLEAQLKEMNPNLDSISEYWTKVSLYNERVEELNKVTQQRDDVKRQLDELMAGFNAISLKLKEMYQTVSFLALVFALHHYKPTSLYVMDEIDAALDFKNVFIVGHYVKDRTKDAQFIIISLRNNVFELAD
nr:structural maintenance of chromosomes protein 4 [Quercus suber]